MINVVNKQGEDGPSSIAFERGSNETFHPYAELSYKSDDWKVYVYAETYKTAGHEGHVECCAFGSEASSAAIGNMITDSKHHTFQTQINYNDLYLKRYYQKIESTIPICFVCLTDVELFDTEEHWNNNLCGESIVLYGTTYNLFQYLGEFVNVSTNYNWIEVGKRKVTAVYGKSISDFKKLFGFEPGAERLSFTLGIRYNN